VSQSPTKVFSSLIRSAEILNGWERMRRVALLREFIICNKLARAAGNHLDVGFEKLRKKEVGICQYVTSVSI